MKARPIIFGAPMIRALLDGRKTQTRRAQGLERYNENPDGWRLATIEEWMAATPNRPGIGGAPPGPLFLSLISGSMQSPVCPYGQPGELLWVRERFYVNDDQEIYYRADGDCCQQIPECQCADVGKPRWRPSIHMPRWLSRLTLEITDVRVERVQEISEKDAIAEGILQSRPEVVGPHRCFHSGVGDQSVGWTPDPAEAYGDLWDDRNARRGYPWSANPWCWALAFRVASLQCR